MINRYFDLIDQNFYFPQEGFDLVNDELSFNGIPINYLIKKYGTPFHLTYLPRISSQIKKARNLFNRAIKTQGYSGKYHYCYCTKSNHFKFVLDEVLKNKVHLETSSEYDMDLILKLYEAGKISENTFIINNGFKTTGYLNRIKDLAEKGLNLIPVIDNVDEVDAFEKLLKKPQKVGIRVATEEEPSFGFYTSRLGIRYSEILPIYKEKLSKSKVIRLEMLHFFVDTGIKDTMYYWGELNKAIKLYCDLKKICPSLNALNIGGGMPIQNSLGFEFDYNYMINEIVKNIMETCEKEGVDVPNIFTEFGKYTVGESGAVIFSVVGQKQQNDSELWYMIDNSIMNTLPDSWGIQERFILLPINKWKNEYTRVNIGGLSCDNSDYYNSEVHENQVYLPKIEKNPKEPLYLGFFNTGAYQSALSGYGGVKHCLIPAPKHIILNRDANGNLTDRLYSGEQTSDAMLSILGY